MISHKNGMLQVEMKELVDKLFIYVFLNIENRLKAGIWIDVLLMTLTVLLYFI